MTDYSMVAQEGFSLFKELAHSEGKWSTVKDRDGIVLEELAREGSPYNCYRISGQVPRSPKEAADHYWGWGTAEWQKLSADVKEFQVVTDLNDDPSRKGRILYQRMALPWPLWHRDVCLYNWMEKEDGACYVLFRSVAHDKVPEKPDQFVRATLLIGGYAFLPVPGEENVAKVVRVLHLEPNGNIPAAIVSMKSNDLHTQMQVYQTMF